MFQLIVAVISIALVAALAIASIYYGGEAFQKSSLRANVVTLVNGGQQISGAAALYKTDFGGIAPTNLQNDLGTTYLSQTPGLSPIATGSWSIVGANAVVEFKTADAAQITAICSEVNRQATGNVAVAGGQFFCANSTGAAVATGATHFAFKL